MTNDHGRKPPPALLGLMVFALLAVVLGRGVFLKEDPPTILSDRQSGLYAELGQGFVNPGLYQFSDGALLVDVIKMTLGVASTKVVISPACHETLVDGTRLELLVIEKKATQIQCGWMSAAQRMAMGIPLHPDRMSRQDWQALPGIGEKLAERIEIDRQQNGDFRNLEALRRVKGIGAHRIKAWSGFF